MTDSTRQRQTPVCPHCLQEMDPDEVAGLAIGMRTGDRVAVDCSACARPFWVDVSVKPAPTPCTPAGQR